MLKITLYHVLTTSPCHRKRTQSPPTPLSLYPWRVVGHLYTARAEAVRERKTFQSRRLYAVSSTAHAKKQKYIRRDQYIMFIPLLLLFSSPRIAECVALLWCFFHVIYLRSVMILLLICACICCFTFLFPFKEFPILVWKFVLFPLLFFPVYALDFLVFFGVYCRDLT